eukprot:34780-Eustigmatos_ZCMA.PRE.1
MSAGATISDTLQGKGFSPNGQIYTRWRQGLVVPAVLCTSIGIIAPVAVPRSSRVRSGISLWSSVTDHSEVRA